MDEKPSPREIDVILEKELHLWGKGEGMITAEISLPNSDPKAYDYDDKTPSLEIVKKSASESKIQLPPEHEKRLVHMLDGAREFETEWKFDFEIAGFSLGPDSPLFFPLKIRFWKKSKKKK